MKSTRLRTPAKIQIQKTPRSRPNSGNSSSKDPVQVYCRIRPMQSDSDLSCLKVISPITVVLTPPEIAVNYKISSNKETQYVFKHVFDTISKQREVYATVAQPLIEGLIRGRNGLLFTYGVTGSGKTYTMTGNMHQQGIMPRCMDVLFKTISEFQAKKFIFKSDRLNGFEVQSETDALAERQDELRLKFSKIRRKESDSDIASQASADVSCLSGIDEDNMYAVFVTFVEVYNNSVYDLLEEGPVQKTLQSKIIREDSKRNMFVHGVTELEVKSVEDATEAFLIGQKRKRMGHTILNAESSRSHAVFTVRLVQAPLDAKGEFIMQDKITISQLSLVDLAGSERTNRTKNTGQRLREAGNINNSLMTLRNCLELLRENQLTGSSKKVPYRDAKITHLFKNYFEGEGQVRMVVCVNPRAEDYDETAQVLKFAELTQEIQVARPTPMKTDAGLTPGRKKANNIFKIAVNNLEENGRPEARNLDIDLGLVYSLGPKFPEIKLNSPDSDQLVLELMHVLEHRILKRQQLNDDLNIRQDRFRNHLLEIEKENLMLKSESASMKAFLSQEKQKSIALENKIIVYESSIDVLNRKLKESEDKLREYTKQLNEKQYLLSQKEIEKEKQKKKFTSKLAVETDKQKREYDARLKEQQQKYSNKAKLMEGKFKIVSEILQSDDVPQLYRSASTESIAQIPQKETVITTQTMGHTPKSIYRGVPVANSRHRRSRSAGEKWLEHRAQNPVPLGTILQPYLPNRKSITKLTDVKDLANHDIENYCLISQGADEDGEVETKVYKGNIIPTTGGGAQVIFNDVECLKQISPLASPPRKRSNNSRPIPAHEITSKCSVGIEGHANKKPRV